MLRAVPSMILTAPSKSAAFRSAIFFCAISVSCFLVILPTLSFWGTPDPLMIPAAFFSRSDAGGVFMMKVNDRSLYTVMITGMMLSPSFWVLALNCLQNSIILTPCCPNDGPTGGAGFALPAGICNLIWADTSFAMRGLLSTFQTLDTFHLQKAQLNRGRAAEDADHYLQAVVILIHLVNHAVKTKERSIHDTDIVGLDEFDLFARTRATRVHLLEQFRHFFIGQRSRLCPAADESSDLGRVLDHLQGFISHRRFQFDQHIA